MQGPPLYNVGPGTCRIVMPNSRCNPKPLRSPTYAMRTAVRTACAIAAAIVGRTGVRAHQPYASLRGPRSFQGLMRFWSMHSGTLQYMMKTASRNDGRFSSRSSSDACLAISAARAAYAAAHAACAAAAEQGLS